MIVGVWTLLIFLTLMIATRAYVYRRDLKWLFTEVYSKALKRSTPLQKEIKAEQKEIAKLRQHKRDMEELEKLKRQEEELFREIKED